MGELIRIPVYFIMGGNVIDDICSSLSLQLCNFGNELDWIQEIEIGFD